MNFFFNLITLAVPVVVAGDITTVVMKIPHQTPFQAVFIATGSHKQKLTCI